MQTIIDEYEFHWWPAFVGYLLLLLISMFSLWLWTHWQDDAQPFVRAKLHLLLLPAVLFIYTLPKFTDLFSVPRVLAFGVNTFTVVGPLNRRRELDYEDIRRLVVISRFSLLVKGRLFLRGGGKVLFNPSSMPDFSKVLQTIRDKGVGQAIELR